MERDDPDIGAFGVDGAIIGTSAVKVTLNRAPPWRREDVTMSTNKYNRSISLACPICSGTKFEHDENVNDEDAEVRCVACDTKYSMRELSQSNESKIQGAVKEIHQNAVRETAARLNKAIKRINRR